MNRVKILLSIASLLVSVNLSAQRIHGEACRGNLNTLDSLLNSNYDINVGNKYDRHRSLLHYAIGCRQDKIFEYLIKKGADVNILDDERRSPLFEAVRMNNPKALNRLIDQGAKVNMIDIYENTPLHMSVLHNNMEITKQLIKNGVDLEAINNRGASALEIAHREGWKEIYQYLLEEGADSNTLRTFHLEGEYFGQEKPGKSPKIFAPNFISTEYTVQNAVFHPNGKEFYFTIISPTHHRGTIMVSKMQNNVWSKPQAMNIPGNYREIDPFITRDGKKLFYCSNRPLNEGDTITTDIDIWMLNREGEDWGQPIHLGNEVNNEELDWFPSISNRGTLYYCKHRKTNDIYYAEFKNGAWQKGIVLSDSVNSNRADYDPFIAPDESYLIFSSNRSGGAGATDLYISYKNEDGSWGLAKNMGSLINSPSGEYTPSLSPDGKYFFFASGRAGSMDLYWIDAQIIEILKN